MPLARTAFEFLGAAHLVVLALTAAVSIGLPLLSRWIGSPRVTRGFAWAIAGILLANEAVYWCHGLATLELDAFLRDHLPLHVCGVALFLLAFALFTRNQSAYEIAYFWGLAGTLQAVVTPNLTRGFPSYQFVQFFLCHGGIVAGTAFATWGMKMRPRRGSVLRVFIISNLFMVAIAGANVLLGANYMFLCGPPDAPTFLFFAGWPWYIVFLEFVAIALFVLLYLPFPLCERLRRRRAQELAQP